MRELRSCLSKLGVGSTSEGHFCSWLVRLLLVECDSLFFQSRFESSSLEKSERLRILNVLSEHVINDTTTGAGGVMGAPMSDFTSAEIYAQEPDVFFRNTPLLMGLSSELPEATLTGRTMQRAYQYSWFVMSKANFEHSRTSVDIEAVGWSQRDEARRTDSLVHSMRGRIKMTVVYWQ